jgi:hypothetical protein
LRRRQSSSGSRLLSIFFIAPPAKIFPGTIIISSFLQKALELLDGWEYEIDHLKVLELVNYSACSAYDCEFVALAQVLGCQLVTSDRQIQVQFPEIAVSPEKFLKGA